MSFFFLELVKIHVEEVKKLMPALKRAKGEFIVKHLGVTYDDFRKEVWVIREFVDGADLEALMKNPSLCPALRSPEKRMTLAVGICKGKYSCSVASVVEFCRRESTGA